ncbi:carboxypeptidase A6 isoform X2 [Phoenix dactylifera]|uniref:Carboxypeptidase A6 isoform X2 n=1 Tax=Phoenix dactylifera TaxID=42345 RepID=A0A8B7BM71_PHODC|nr:carboxypeptidase A6 isoform X2 [Phoenix dactylifera]
MGFLLLPLYFLSLLLIVFSAAVHGANSSASSMTPIPRDLYHSSGALLNEIEALASRHPDVLTMEKMRADNKGYAAEIVVITYNHVKKQTNNKSKFRILLSFGQHGRELITSEVALHLLSVLAKEQKMLSMQPTSFNKILENIVIKVVPMENLNGRKLVEGGELCERRNGRGVDLNRNWSVDWGKKEKDYDPYEENPGIAPFSEPEAQIMRKLAKSFEPHIWVNVHSGMEALFMPYDHKNSTPNGLTSRLMRSMLQDLNHRYFQDKCLVGSGGGSVGYLAHGTTTDYMYDIAKVPMAFTFEIYGDLSASSKDCFKMFNPVDKVTFNRVLNKWVATFLMLFEMVPSRLHSIHLAVSSVKLVPIGGNVVDGSLIGDSRESKKIEGLELGMQELRTYFRLFLLSSVLLMFMFCSRISKSKCRPACPNLAI